MIKKSILFLTKDYRKSNFEYSSYNHKNRLFEQAVKSGLHVYISSWNNLVVRGKSIFIVRGISKTIKKESQIKKPIAVHPIYINSHINSDGEHIVADKFSSEILGYLIKNSVIKNNLITDNVATHKYISHLIKKFWKKSFFSYNPHISYIGKWYLEKYLKAAESKNIFVHRPESVLSTKQEIPGKIKSFFEGNGEEFLIVKSHVGTRLEGIFLFNREDYEKQLDEFNAFDEDFFVMQKYISNTYPYKDRKTDLRIYVGVFSWDPLIFRVYPYGLTRVASKPFNPESFYDKDGTITTFGLLNGPLEYNPTIEEYFDQIPEHKNETIWKSINSEIENTLKGILAGGKLPAKDLKNTIYLLGFDVMMAKEDNGCIPYILEVNHFPTLYRSKENDPDQKTNNLLDKTYLQFFKDVLFYSSKHKLLKADF